MFAVRAVGVSLANDDSDNNGKKKRAIMSVIGRLFRKKKAQVIDES